MRAAVAQLPGAIPPESDVLLCHPAACHPLRPPSAHIHHPTVQPSGVDQDGPDESRKRRTEARRTESAYSDNMDSNSDFDKIETSSHRLHNFNLRSSLVITQIRLNLN